MENVIAEIKKMEKEKSLQLEKLEQLQFRKGIATTRKAEISEQIKTVNNFKTEKESNRTLVMRRVETRQAQFDDLNNKISQCRAGIERNQEDLNQQSERQFDMIRELEEATVGLSIRMGRSCAISIGSPGDNQEISQLDKEIQVLLSSVTSFILNPSLIALLFEGGGDVKQPAEGEVKRVRQVVRS